MSLGLRIGLGMLRSPANGWTPASLGSSLAMWCEADNITESPTGKVAAYLDKSAGGRSWSQSTLANKPTLLANGINGRPALYFDSAGKRLTGVSFSALSTSILYLCVLQLDADPPAAGLGGAWDLSATAGTETYLPYSGDGLIYDLTFTTVRKSTGLAMGAGYFASRRIYTVYSAANDWRLFTDGVQRYQTTSNTVSFPSSGTCLGADSAIPTTVYCRGKQALHIAVSPAPAPGGTDFLRLHRWVGARYGITTP